jgi:hypothetical protein
LAIADTGAGMTEDVRRHALEPFFTTKGRSQGTGLGLATVYGIVTQAGGDMEIRSELGEGTTIELYLPASPGLTVEAVPTALAELRGGAGQAILVVEDDPGILTSTRRILTGSGYEVTAFGSAEEALSFWDAGSATVDLLLSDVMLPGLSGAELARRLHRDRPDLPVLFVSAYTGGVLDRAELGPDVQLLAKPVPVDVLLAKVAELLDDRAAPVSPDQPSSTSDRQ